AMAEQTSARASDAKMDATSLYREEIYTDRAAGTLRVMTPVKPDGSPDGARETVFIGEAQILTNMGPLPISFEVEAKNLAEAIAAAEVKVLAAGPLTQQLKEIVSRFEQETGGKVRIVYGNAGSVRAMLEKGDAADVVVLPGDAIADAQARGLVQAGTRVDLAAVNIGVAMKNGVAPPDISTPDALKRALLAAKAVAYSDPARATSGKHF